MKAFNNSRKIVKLGPFLIGCIVIGAVLCMMMESMETKSVVNALVRLQLKMGKNEKVSMNSGTNLIELKRMSEISNGLLKFKELCFIK